MSQPVQIKTQDGVCPTYVYTPSQGAGPWPAVIYYMDALGIRPSVFAMGQKMADLGYVVLVPDLFYRLGHYEPLVPKEVFALPDPRVVFGHMFSATSPQKAVADTQAWIDYIDTRTDVKGDEIGVTGYCMGGTMALNAAAAYPDRITVAASFHAGNLATDAPDSAHLLAPKLAKTKVLVAGADNDAHYPPEMAAKVEKALTDAGVDHRCEIYEGCLHGWTQTDFPIYNPAGAERHWTELDALFKGVLG
jgi:carboxymethylenebutenolidase